MKLIYEWVKSEANTPTNLRLWKDRINLFLGTNQSISTISNLFKQLGITIKKGEEKERGQFLEQNKILGV